MSIETIETDKYKLDTITVNYERTDTFGGEANYCWVRRGTLQLPREYTDRQMVAAVKKALEITGLRCDRLHNYEDGITLKPRGIHQVIFITFEY